MLSFLLLRSFFPGALADGSNRWQVFSLAHASRAQDEHVGGLSSSGEEKRKVEGKGERERESL